MKIFTGKTGDAISHIKSETSNPQLAAAIIAIDVPLLKTAPMNSFVGDGIKGTLTTWQFYGASPTGNTADMVIKVWHDDKWLEANASHTVAKIKIAFDAMYQLSRQAQGRGDYFQKCELADTVYTASTIQAATMIALGHVCLGYKVHASSYFWQFAQSAAVDMDLWADKLIHEKLPAADLSYIKVALLNWKQLISDIKTATHTAVKHGKRTAYIGRDDDAKAQSQIEKLLYRK